MDTKISSVRYVTIRQQSKYQREQTHTEVVFFFFAHVCTLRVRSMTWVTSDLHNRGSDLQIQIQNSNSKNLKRFSSAPLPILTKVMCLQTVVPIAQGMQLFDHNFRDHASEMGTKLTLRSSRKPFLSRAQSLWRNSISTYIRTVFDNWRLISTVPAYYNRQHSTYMPL